MFLRRVSAFSDKGRKSGREDEDEAERPKNAVLYEIAHNVRATSERARGPSRTRQQFSRWAPFRGRDQNFNIKKCRSNGRFCRIKCAVREGAVLTEDSLTAHSIGQTSGGRKYLRRPKSLFYDLRKITLLSR